MKKKKYPKKAKTSFYMTENTQEYRLQNFAYLYDTPKDNTELFKELYDNVPVLQSAVEVYATLVNSDYYIESTSERLNDEVKSICEAFNIDAMLTHLVTDISIYGFSGIEIVLNNQLNMIEKWVGIPANELKIERDKEGNITNFLQGAGMTASKQAFNVLDPRRVLFATKNGTVKEPYGRSMFRSLPFLTKIMLEMQDSMGKVYKKYASPRFHVKYTPTIPLDQATLTARMNAIKQSFNNLEVGKDFFTAGDVTVEVVGSGGKELKFNAELGEIMQGIFSGLGLPAGVLGYNYGSTETHLAKQIEILLAKITKYQKSVAALLNTKLMPLIAKVYNLSEIPKFCFTQSVIADEDQQAQIESRKIDDTIKLLDKQIITLDEAKKRLTVNVKSTPQGGNY